MRQCPTCDGDGWLEREVVDGGVNSNGTWQAYRVHEVVCSSCDGAGDVDDSESIVFRLF